MKTKVLRNVVIILGGMALPLTLMSGALAANNMTFQDEVDVEFTFEPTLSVTLADVISANVAPGTSSYSESPLAITVTTNSLLGYNLSAKMTGASGNNSLVKTGTSAAFTSLANNAATTLANFDANNWGYTVATTMNNETTFSGLDYNSYKTINATTNMTGTPENGYVGGNVTNFRIGAKASSTQVAGDYTNVITFTAIANVTRGAV